MKAEIAKEERRYIVCPTCGKADGFRVDHLDDCPDGFRFGPWSCADCGNAISGRTAKPGAEIEQAPGERRAPALVLLEIGESTPPVYVVLKDTIYQPDDPASWDLTYFVEEHTCPTNLIRSEAILWDGDSDPHGVLRFVQAVPRPDGYAEENYSSWADWAMLFDRLPGQTIEGATIVRGLGAPSPAIPASPPPP